MVVWNILGLLFVFAVSIFALLIVVEFANVMLGAVFSPDLGKPKHRAEDLWDEPDGGVYIVLPNGEVRLD